MTRFELHVHLNGRTVRISRCPEAALLALAKARGLDQPVFQSLWVYLETVPKLTSIPLN